MGGPGSGTWYRWKSTKTTFDEVHRLDVRWLQRHGYLQRWARGVLTWHRGEHDAGAVGVALEDGRLVVAYRVKASGGDWEPVRQVLDLDWTPCHYGGQRPWFRCPGSYLPRPFWRKANTFRGLFAFMPPCVATIELT
jgi:hypothetical protein